MTSSPPLLSVVLPAYNEQEALPVVIGAIAAALQPWSHEIVVVDDGSTDGTWAAVMRLGRERGVRGVRFTRNFGHQAALLAGLSAARGKAVITMDADGQHPVDLLPLFVRRWESGAPVVQGIRARDGDASMFKRSTRALFYRLMRRLAGVDIPTGSADFRLLSRPVVDEVLTSAGPLLFLRGLVPWLGYEAERIPFDAQPRIAGRTAYGLARMVRLSVDGLLGFSIVPLRLAVLLGLIIAGVSFAYLAYVVVIRFTAGNVVPGWASTAGLLSLLGGIQLLTMGVLGEYVGRLFLANLNRPPYVVRDRIGPESAPGDAAPA